MATFVWYDNEVPDNLKVKQVYGLVFSKDGRMLVRVVNKPDGRKMYCLAGGTPEPFDKDMEATLRREFIEEVNTTLQTPIYAGYQLVDEENGKPPYAQVRMVALIDEIGPKQPDPDNGETYDRMLVHPDKVISLLNWGKVLVDQIATATQIAKTQLGITEFVDQDEDV